MDQHHPPPSPGFGPPPPGFTPPPPPSYVPDAQAPAPYLPDLGAGPAPFPDFLASDRHSAVVIDEDGARLEQRGLSIDFTWAEIRTIHYTGQFGWLLVGVMHTDGRFYECRVRATRQDQLHEWLTEIAPVIGYYLTPA
ncbi:hypothetical protein [Streptomyces apocyni]|uniref:hypothetical protein n=1 Tax=Streptomyces apocyni TaxID=2654677 RepID=UPI0012EACEE4|nr:hypothetical protein [Streptomyces apocyni]